MEKGDRFKLHAAAARNYGGHLLDQIVPFFLVSFQNLCIVIMLIASLTISISLMEATFDHFDF